MQDMQMQPTPPSVVPEPNSPEYLADMEKLMNAMDNAVQGGEIVEPENLGLTSRKSNVKSPRDVMQQRMEEAENEGASPYRDMNNSMIIPPEDDPVQEEEIEEANTEPSEVVQEEASPEESNFAKNLREERKLRYQFFTEKAAKDQEIEQLRGVIQQALALGYDQNAAAAEYHLQTAQDKYVTALESGDARAAAKASQEVASAQLELHEANRNRQYQSQYNQNSSENIQAPNPEKQLTDYWFSKNKEVVAGNPEYDMNLHKAVADFTVMLDNNIANGRVDAKVFSPDYFAKIDDFIDVYKKGGTRPQTQNRPQQQQTQSVSCSQPPLQQNYAKAQDSQLARVAMMNAKNPNIGSPTRSVPTPAPVRSPKSLSKIETEYLEEMGIPIEAGKNKWLELKANLAASKKAGNRHLNFRN